MAGAVTGGILHTGDGGSGDRRDTSYWRWWEQQQECHFILEMAGAVTGGRLHTSDTGNRGSSDREHKIQWDGGSSDRILRIGDVGSK